jgi:hypothetical protein
VTRGTLRKKKSKEVQWTKEQTRTTRTRTCRMHRRSSFKITLNPGTGFRGGGRK